MQNDILATLTRLSDAALVAQVKTLVCRERDATAEVVAHLAELDTRDVHLREGYPSLYVYCREVLGLSEWEAYNRIEVARTVRRFPTVLGMLADGSVYLTAVRRLAPHLTAANHEELLDSARGKTTAEIEQIVARLSPRPDVAASVRPLHLKADQVVDGPGFVRPGLENACEPTQPGGASPDPGSSVPVPAEGNPQVGTAAVRGSEPTPPVAVPLSPNRYRLQLTISGETLEKLAWLRTC